MNPKRCKTKNCDHEKSSHYEGKHACLVQWCDCTEYSETPREEEQCIVRVTRPRE